jgi:hypothetical protein
MALGCIPRHSTIQNLWGNLETCQDDDIINFGGNSETCQDDNITVLFTNIVFISYRKIMLIYAIAQMIIIDLVALDCIP